MHEYRRMFDVNFWGPMQLAQVMMPMLRQSRGRVINVTSASVYLTIPVGSAYVVSKVALKSLTQHLRLEMVPFGVQVTSLEPGGVDTAMTDFTPELGEQQWDSIPEALRDQYRQHFRDGGSVIGENFTLIEPDDIRRSRVEEDHHREAAQAVVPDRAEGCTAAVDASTAARAASAEHMGAYVQGPTRQVAGEAAADT